MEGIGATHRYSRCDHLFKTKTKLKSHLLRKTPCAKPTYFCAMCNRGLSSYRTLWAHKKVCKKRPGVSVENEEKIQNLRKQVNTFLNQLNEDFSGKLNELDKLFMDTGNEVQMEEEKKDNKEDECIENDS